MPMAECFRSSAIAERAIGKERGLQLRAFSGRCSTRSELTFPGHSYGWAATRPNSDRCKTQEGIDKIGKRRFSPTVDSLCDSNRSAAGPAENILQFTEKLTPKEIVWTTAL